MEPKRNFIRTLAIACTIVAIVGAGIWYVASDVETKFQTVQQQRVDIQTKERSLSALASLQGDAEKAKQYLPQVDRFFTTKKQLLSFSTDISFLAQQSGFSGSPRFKEETGPQAGELQKTNFELFLEGPKSLDDLAAFFAAVDRSNYFVRFTAIDVVREGASLRASIDGYVISF